MTPESVEPPLNVLIIDDEVGLRDMLQYSLKKRGFSVVGAANGEEAFALLLKNDIDVIVCDIMMPGISGVEVLKQIKEQYPDVEVIMATGYATLETAIEAMKNGAFDYITKPYSLSHLCALFEKAQEHRRLKAKVGYLEELSKLKSEFMATMSHELRTPLASILGYISLLAKNIYGPLSEKQLQVLSRVDLSAKNLLQLINNILDLSKLSAHRMTLTPEDFDFGKLLNEVSEAMEPLVRAKKLTLTIPSPDAMTIYVDRTKLKQVLINLIGNAVKFTTQGSITVHLDVLNDRLDFEVRDTGIGISAEDLPRLFQEFKQLDGSTTREYAGTGLGLAITKKIVELMSGTILVESEVNKGTVFKVHLPNHESQVAPLHIIPQTVIVPKTGEKIILSIDDDPDVLKVLQDGLAGTGYRTVGALSGEEGLALARQLHPQVVTLDIMMPHMDGWSVLKVFKNDPELKDIPIYVVSIVDNKALAFSLGVTDYILKPFTQEELLQKLRLIHKSKTQHVLVVDDDPEISRLLTESISQEGFDVETVKSGEDAMARMKQVTPDVIFLDLALPQMTGFEVLEAIARLSLSEAPAIFVMADKELTQEQEQVLSGRVTMVVQKKTELQAMTTMLREKLRSLRDAA